MKFDAQTKYDKQQQEYEEEISFSLSDFMKTLTVGKPSITEKAVFLCKFQRGLDASTLADRFNFQALEQINKYFKTDNHVSWNLDLCPVPVKLIRMKTGFLHMGFLDGDAIEALQDYLDFIKSKNIILDKALFVNKFGNPISDSWITRHFFNLTVRSGIQEINPNFNRGFRYAIGSHELRDLLKSTLIDSGCRIDVADHVIGHMPKDSYEKQTKLYPETMRKEYAKASKRLNIFTKFTSIVNGTDDADELKLQLKDVLEKRLDDEAERIRSEKFAIEQQRQVNQLQNTVNDLLKKENKRTRQEEKPLDFCCISCELVHDKESCPACGSKQRKIYESKVQN
jgi:rubrerythrin